MNLLLLVGLVFLIKPCICSGDNDSYSHIDFATLCCEQLLPILNNDDCAISPSSARYKMQSTYQTIHKHDISPAAKVALSVELAKVNWDFIKEKSVDEKV